MHKTVKIKLTGDSADLAFQGWAHKTGLKLEKQYYVGEEIVPSRGQSVSAAASPLPFCFVEMDVVTFKTRLCKLSEK